MTAEEKKTLGIDDFAERLDEIFAQGMPTKAQIYDAYNKAVDKAYAAQQKSEIKMPTELIDNFQLVTDFGEAHKTLHPKTQQTKWSGVLWLSEWLRNQIDKKI